MIFSRADRPDAVEKAVRKLAVAGFRRAGITVAVDRGERGAELIDTEHDATFILHNLVEAARTADRTEWPAMVDSWVESHVAALAEPELADLSVDNLRQQLRVQLISADHAMGDDLSYAPEWAPGILKVLCLDTPATVSTLTTDALADLPLTVDELYRQGQANTDAEPVDDQIEIDQAVRGLTGDSFFIAAKTANFGALAEQIGPAPYGIVFALPNRHLLVYSVLDQEDWLESAAGVTEVAYGLSTDDDLDHPGGIISADSYYWAPDGTIERLGGQVLDPAGEPSLTVTPGEAFARHLLLGDR